jgi:hypothetical protein
VLLLALRQGSVTVVDRQEKTRNPITFFRE